MRGIFLMWLILTGAIIIASYKHNEPRGLNFFINALMRKMASGVIAGFVVYGFWPGVFGFLVISVVTWLLSSFIGEQGKVEYIGLKHKGGNRWE